MAKEQWTTVHMFWAEGGDDVFHVRNVFPPGGLVSDPNRSTPRHGKRGT
jgi:hypothetical protein